MQDMPAGVPALREEGRPMSELLKAIETTTQEARDGYGLNPEPSFLKPYEWFMMPGIKNARARCREHGLTMKWAMKVSKDYPPRPAKHDDRVIINGLLLQIWKCPHEGCEVEAVK